jgi:hypothetical protein
MQKLKSVNEKISVVVFDIVDEALYPAVKEAVYNVVWGVVYVNIRCSVVWVMRDAVTEGVWNETMGDTR